MKKSRKHYSPEEKVAILRRHLLENEPISKLCDELGCSPRSSDSAVITSREVTIWIFGLLNSEESYSYKIDYRRFFSWPHNARKLLILLVGAGRFERPTPCAQGSF